MLWRRGVLVSMPGRLTDMRGRWGPRWEQFGPNYIKAEASSGLGPSGVGLAGYGRKQGPWRVGAGAHIP